MDRVVLHPTYWPFEGEKNLAIIEIYDTIIVLLHFKRGRCNHSRRRRFTQQKTEVTHMAPQRQSAKAKAEAN